MAYVAGRLALIIGSECDALGELVFPTVLATGLHDSLVQAGGWSPALDRDGPVLNPCIADLRAAITDAFTAADAQRATLLVAFVGHGMTKASSDFFLLARNSPAVPDSQSAFHLAQGIREQLDRATSLDGLIVLVDACEAGEAVVGATHRWLDLLGAGGGRMDLLVGSGSENAYGGCFTRTLLATFSEGIAARGDNLLCADVVPTLARKCRRQIPQHLSFTAGNAVMAGRGDAGLWLVPNIARQMDAVTGQPAAGLVDQLTRGVIVTDSLRGKLAEVIDSTSRLRLIIGPGGCGKSTLLALLIRPSMVDTLTITAGYVSGAVFADATSTMESITQIWVAQLRQRLAGFPEAQLVAAAGLSDSERTSLDTFERDLLRPLRLCHQPGRKIHLLLDGLDQPEEGSRDFILSRLEALTSVDVELGHVRVIISARGGAGLDEHAALRHAERIELSRPSPADLVIAMQTSPTVNAGATTLLLGKSDGGWLIARLLAELDDKTHAWDLPNLVHDRVSLAARTTAQTRNVLGVLALLVAAGVGPVLPLELMTLAFATDASLTTAQTRNILVNLGTLVSRGNPGQPQERVGIAHAVIADALSADTRLREEGLVVSAHKALIRALETLNDTGGATPLIVQYAALAGPRHHLAVGDSAGALQALVAADGLRPADNRDRWASWVGAFEALFGADHPDTWTAYGNLAYWRSETGDHGGAAAEFERLLANRLRVLGPDHPDTLTTRSQLASCLGQAGNVIGAATMLEELLADRLRVQGAEHPDTLTTRAQFARWKGHAGDRLGSATDLIGVLPDMIRILKPDHPAVFKARGSIARFLGDEGDFVGAVAAYADLLTDVVRVLKPDDPDTLNYRGSLAWWRGRAGDSQGAQAEYKALLADRLRLLGADHPDTLTTRRDLARWRGDAGDFDGAAAAYKELLPDVVRVLGPDHQNTLNIRHSLAHWCGATGNPLGAVAMLEDLLTDRLRLFGPDHPDTLSTIGELARWRPK